MKMAKVVVGTPIVTAVENLAKDGYLRGFHDYRTWDPEFKEKILKSLICSYIQEKMRFAVRPLFIGDSFTKVAELGETHLEVMEERTVTEMGMPTRKMVPVKAKYVYQADILVKVTDADPDTGLFDIQCSISEFPYLYREATKDHRNVNRLPAAVFDKYEEVKKEVEDILSDIEYVKFTDYGSMKPVINAFYKALNWNQMSTWPALEAFRLGLVHQNAMDIFPDYANASTKEKMDTLERTHKAMQRVETRGVEHITLSTYAKYFFYELVRGGFVDSVKISLHFMNNPGVPRMCTLNQVVFRNLPGIFGQMQSTAVGLDLSYVYGHEKVLGEDGEEKEVEKSFRFRVDAHEVWSRLAESNHNEEE